MIEAATIVLLVALPFLLWPLLRPPPEPAEDEKAQEKNRDHLQHWVEEVELDLASGRLDRSEAERRLAELRGEPG